MNKKHISLDIPWPNLSQAWAFARKWLLPNPGTLILMVVLALAVPALAGPSQAPSATSTSVISYQGRLADSSGNPLTGRYNLEFRIYDVPTGGVPLWTELWTGGSAVDVSDGLFNVMLGSINTTLASAIQGRNELYLGITVGTDSEMSPRVQLGSVPFSMQAMTVPDGSITTAKIADRAVIGTWYTSPTSAATIPGNTDWTDVVDTSLTFSLTSSAEVFFSYSINIEPISNPSSDGIAVRLLVDGTGNYTRGASGFFQPLTSGDSNANLNGNLVLALSPGQHTVRMQWKSYGSTGWSSNPALHDGFAQGRSITVIAFYR